MEKIKIEQHSFAGTLWFAAWLFTLGFLHLSFWRAVLAILLWPYYLGVALGPAGAALASAAREPDAGGPRPELSGSRSPTPPSPR